jgi:hypothetical protein
LCQPNAGGDGITTFQWSTNSNDCCDIDPAAYPTQTAYFTYPDYCGSFDFNCDGILEAQFPLGGCAAQPATNCPLESWPFATVSPDVGVADNSCANIPTEVPQICTVANGACIEQSLDESGVQLQCH